MHECKDYIILLGPVMLLLLVCGGRGLCRPKNPHCGIFVFIFQIKAGARIKIHTVAGLVNTIRINATWIFDAPFGNKPFM